MRDLPIRAMARSHATEKRKMVRPAGFEPATLGLEGHGTRFALHPITAHRSVQHWQHRLRNDLASKPSRTVRPSPRSQPATLGLEGHRSVFAVFVPGRARVHVQDRLVERTVRELRVTVGDTRREQSAAAPVGHHLSNAAILAGQHAHAAERAQTLPR